MRVGLTALVLGKPGERKLGALGVGKEVSLHAEDALVGGGRDGRVLGIGWNGAEVGGQHGGGSGSGQHEMAAADPEPSGLNVGDRPGASRSFQRQFAGHRRVEPAVARQAQLDGQVGVAVAGNVVRHAVPFQQPPDTR